MSNTLFDIEFFHEDLYELMFRFTMNFVFIFVAVRLIYYPKTRRRDYQFTYFLISTVIFFLCFVLRKKDIDMGLALGLFAIFGIIRYRTNPVNIKEMTYLFVVIGISVINALAKKTSYSELFFTNACIIGMLFAMELIWFQRQMVKRTIHYDRTDLILPEKRAELIADLEKRTGLTVEKVEIGKTDYVKDTCDIKVYFYDEYPLTDSDDN